VFHVTRGPMSLPSFVHDVAWAFAEWVNEESYKFAATGKAEYPLVAPEGGKEPLRAEYSAFTMGSDHDVYQDSSFGIPAIYLNDWPDRYIHTNFDTAANIDPTKLKRAAFIGAASGYFLAQEKEADLPAINWLIFTDAMERRARTIRRGDAQQSARGLDLMRRNVDYDVQLARSPYRFLALDVAGAALVEGGMRELPAIVRSRPGNETSGDGLLRFARKSEPKGLLLFSVSTISRTT